MTRGEGNGDRRVPAAAFAVMALAAAQPTAADTLEELMDGCLQVMTEGNYSGVSGFGVKRMEGRYWGSIRKIDGRPVSLLIQHREDESIHACSVVGMTFGDDDTVTDPGLSWADGLPRALAWMDAAAAMPARAEIPVYGPPTRTFAACPDRSREGFLVTIAPGNFGSKTTAMPEEARPFHFIASRVNNPDQACGFVP